MKINDLDSATLRRLSGLRPPRGKVLSIYLDLDPSEFATPAARATAITSLLDEAERLARQDGFQHDERVALREDVARAREFFTSEFTARSAGAVALFACGPANLFEALRLPRPTASTVVVDDTPWIEPLARIGGPEHLCVALVNRRTSRILRGSRERLEEVATVEDDVHGRHDQGGWSQPRYQRGIEKEVQDHLANTADRLFRGWKRRPFDSLLVAAAEELWPALEERLHPYLRERVVARFDADVENVSPADVVRLVSPVLEEADRERERRALARVEEGLGSAGNAETGLDAVLGALNERRVDLLVYTAGLRRPGVACPRCSWLGVEGTACPFDGGPLESRDDVVEDAIEAAVLQSAVPLAVRDPEALSRFEGIAAVLRF
jgi:peptide chain release factor subunit 1